MITLLQRCVHAALNARWVPNKPGTPTHSIRVPDDLWQAVVNKARERGETLTDVVIRALKAYLRD